MTTRITRERVPASVWPLLHRMATGPVSGRVVVPVTPGRLATDPWVVMRRRPDGPWRFRARRLHAAGGRGLSAAWTVEIRCGPDGTATITSRRSDVAAVLLGLVSLMVVAVLVLDLGALIFPPSGGSFGYFAGWGALLLALLGLLVGFGRLLVADLRGRAAGERRIADLVLTALVSRADSSAVGSGC